MLNAASKCLTVLRPVTHHQLLLHSRLLWVCVSVLGWRCRLLFLFYHLLSLLWDPVVVLVLFGLFKLVLSLVVGVVLWVQLTVYTLQTKRSGWDDTGKESDGGEHILRGTDVMKRKH